MKSTALLTAAVLLCVAAVFTFATSAVRGGSLGEAKGKSDLPKIQKALDELRRALLAMLAKAKYK